LIVLSIGGCRASAARDDTDSAQPAAPVVMAVSAAKVTIAPMRSEVRLLGTTVALRHHTLRAPAAGRLVGFELESGDHVRSGQVVAHIVSREVEAASQGLAVARQIDPSEADSLGRAVRRYSGGAGVAVVAPADAIVAQRNASSGQLVAEMDQLADLIDPHSVYVEAAVPIDQLRRLRPGMDAVVSSLIQPGAKFPARVREFAPAFSAGGATFPLRLEFIGDQRISAAGAPVEVSVTTADVPDAIVIPTTALYQEASTGAFYVFVAGPDAIAHRVTVTLGIRDGAQAQVNSGLKPGQLVITSGGYALSEGLRVKAEMAQQ
jgi:multidrug efflux system membrane fusion protein